MKLEDLKAIITRLQADKGTMDDITNIVGAVPSLIEELERLAEENKNFQNGLAWLSTDMTYKAPEQVFERMQEMWIPKIGEMLNDQ